MTKQERTIALATLIPLLYAAGIWLESGFFLIPSPLLDLIYLFAVIIFSAPLIKASKYSALFSIAYALSTLLSQSFLWSLVLSDVHLEDFVNEGNLDLFELIAGIFYLIWGGITILQQRSIDRILLFFVFLGTFIAAVLFNWQALFLVSSLLPYLLSFRYKDIHPYHLLWLQLTLFGWMKWVMFQWTA